MKREEQARIAVVIPSFNVEQSIEAVIESIPFDVWRIYCVDDCSDDETWSVISRLAESDPRVRGVRRSRNGGVGAAFVDGLSKALEDSAEIVVKVDGDGQMNGAFVDDFARPIMDGEADYVKGNRFFDIERVLAMPRTRLVGNAGLSFLSKLSTGYWNLFDPANGYVAIHADVARLIPVKKLHQRYFFESDLLFRLAILRAKVIELPLETVYEDETSHLNVWRCLVTFPFLHARNFLKRLFYNYVLRNFSLGSVVLPTGLLLVALGATYGVTQWIDSLRTGEPATAGTVMLSALPVLVGIQFVLSFLAQDVSSVPDAPIHKRLVHKTTIFTPGREARRK
ncbi:glycosyltransferase family 2 protein [Sphingomonas sp. G124]|uniref:Glycosyltransferase family 2 protein n=1 Tax=Sphingomonas cremea TaxID=2904799 RepID=A0A9X1QMV6_9SPHN|nr:glycosyltransferase family 2 protein [Sphingomonas cremea]MCF2514803.1 glycosyltransferase family 2 protein [Sphingomonas cremea]